MHEDKNIVNDSIWDSAIFKSMIELTSLMDPTINPPNRIFPPLKTSWRYLWDGERIDEISDFLSVNNIDNPAATADPIIKYNKIKIYTIRRINLSI